MDFTWPDVSTNASSVTLFALLVAKSRNASGETIARTDLINFGGTIATPSERGATETSAALLDGSGAERLPTEAAISGFPCTAAAFAAPSGADLIAAGVSGTASVESFAVPNGAGCDASCKTACGGVVRASLVCGDLTELAWVFAVF